MTTQSLLSQGYKSLGWANQYDNNPTFWERYRSLTWQVVACHRDGYTLEVCHDTKEFLESDSSD